MEHCFPLLFKRHLVIRKYARGTLDAGCAMVKSEVVAFTCSFIHSFTHSLIHSFDDSFWGTHCVLGRE